MTQLNFLHRDLNALQWALNDRRLSKQPQTNHSGDNKDYKSPYAKFFFENIKYLKNPSMAEQDYRPQQYQTIGTSIFTDQNR